MKYTSPEINLLGDAASVVQLTGIKAPMGSLETNPQPGQSLFFNPAYDLDEY